MLVKSKSQPCFNLSFVDGLYSTANDLDRVGAAVDTQRDDRSWCRVEPYAREWERKEDKINLDKEWCIPDQLNKPDNKRSNLTRESRRMTPPIPIMMASAMPDKANQSVPRHPNSSAGSPSMTGVKSNL
jgi:hypothetical protein